MNLICGINPVLEALSAGSRHFDRLLVVKGLRNQRVSDAMARATQMGVPLRFEARETLDRMAGGLPHQGVIAVVSPKPVIPVEELLQGAHDPALVVVLDGVEDPRNLGAILRSAEAAGADGVLLPDRHNAGLSETVSRASAGALEHVKVARIGNVAQAIEALKARGFWVVGFDAEGKERWDAVDYKRSVAIVLGGEGKGIRRLVRERCDHVVSLPLFGQVTSLNVSVVAGIALYEVIRQRGVAPSHVRPIPPKRLHALEANIGPTPGDSEHDPGRHLHTPSHDAEPPEDADEPWVDTGEEEVVVTGIHEEVAWAGPTVVKTDERARARRGDGRDDRRRDGRRGHRRPQGTPRAAAPPAGPEAQPAGEGKDRSRRRRRGRGRGPSAPTTPSQGAPPGEGPSPPPERSSPPADGGAPPGAPAQGHRRRRRRHR
ncbi:MAG: 23S rRNA (guanosine(2251)-2'-O)-methyltransferase RlmB [Vicinamibacteria bacterium]